MGRPKQEYEERGPDEEGTPLERFQRLVKRVVSVPRAELEERERRDKERRAGQN